MSRDITPTQSRVPVFVLARLCANTEIGVPSGEAHRNDEGGGCNDGESSNYA